MNSSVPLGESPVSTSRACKHAAAAKPSRQRCVCPRAAAKEITLLDYGAGNVRSVRNAIKKLGYNIKDVSTSAVVTFSTRALNLRTKSQSFDRHQQVVDSNSASRPL